MSQFLVAALYKFVSLPDAEALRAPMEEMARAGGIKGTLLLAGEGINGTIAGREPQLRRFLSWLREDPRFADLEHKESLASEMPFRRMKVRLKKEIVTMGVPEADPSREVGAYVEPEDWNALISDPGTVLIDTRNAYEVAIGTFKGAIDPQTERFRQFPEWTKENAALKEKRKVAMFCTGGIRCEKATAFMKMQGFDEVYHLKGGILKYLETVPPEESLWEGECFVFDERVAVGHGLEEGSYELCRGCRHPINAADKASPLFMEGVSCPHCHDRLSEEQKRRFADRQKQMELAEKRGVVHLGDQPGTPDEAA